MQTVTQIIAGGGPAAAAPAADARAPGTAFPSTLQRAMTSGNGKTLPDEAGQTVPDGAEAAAAETGEAAVDPAIVGTVTDDTPPETTPGAVTVASDTPHVAHVLRDIAAGRNVASRSGAPSTSVESAEPATPRPAAAESIAGQRSAASRDDVGDDSAPPAAAEDRQALSAPTAPLPLVVDPQTAPNPVAATATQHAREVVLGGPAAAHAAGLLSKATTPSSAPVVAGGDTITLPDAPAAPPTTTPLSVGDAATPTAAQNDAVLASDAATPAAAANGAAPASAPSHGAADAAALGAPALLASAGTAAPPPAGAAATPGAAVELNMAAPPGSPQFGPELGERLLWLVRDGMHEARLQLNPRELGPVEVRLSVADGAAHVSFSAQHAGTVAAVQQSLPQLRELLTQQGFQLGQATVSHQPAGDGQATQQHAKSSGGQPGWDNRQGNEVEVRLPTPSARVIGRGLVDAYA